MSTSNAQTTTVPALPPWPDDALSYVTLPATGDDGFPQVFLLQLQGTVYQVTMAV
jgi:hypothetical protein